MIEITKVPDGYIAKATPPHVRENFDLLTASPAKVVIAQLLAKGAHQTEVRDALYAADPYWLTVRRPRRRDVYRVREPFTAGVLTQWKAPFTGGYDRILPVGLEFCVNHDPREIATAASVRAISPERWATMLVDKADLESQSSMVGTSL